MAQTYDSFLICTYTTVSFASLGQASLKPNFLVFNGFQGQHKVVSLSSQGSFVFGHDLLVASQSAYSCLKFF